MPYHRAIKAKAKEMKKNPNSSDLAAKIAAAARLPAGARTVSVPVLVSPPPVAKAAANEPVQEPTRAKQKKRKPKDPDTVAITLRPSGELLNKFVLKAAERTREEGRVVSAQQIMLEALERSVP
jgi:hypothetical protein